MNAEFAEYTNIFDEPSTEQSPDTKMGQHWQRQMGKAFDSVHMDYDKSLYDEEVNAEQEYKKSDSPNILNQRINFAKMNTRNEGLSSESGEG